MPVRVTRDDPLNDCGAEINRKCGIKARTHTHKKSAQTHSRDPEMGEKRRRVGGGGGGTVAVATAAATVAAAAITVNAI